MANRIVGHIDEDTLSNLRVIVARKTVMFVKHGRYSREEMEETLIAESRLMGDIASRLGVNASRQWSVDNQTGLVFYQAWPWNGQSEEGE
jgi:hypothetical protein